MDALDKFKDIASIGLVAFRSFFFGNVDATINARTKASTEDKKEFEWATDDDDDRRKCSVRWSKRRIFGLNNRWAFTFNWGDYEATYQAGDVGGYLIPQWNKGGPEPHSPNGETYKWKQDRIFDVICSPKEVNTKARAVPYNGARFILTKVNGQLWLVTLAQGIGIEHPTLSANDEMFIPKPIAAAVDKLYAKQSHGKND